MKPVADYSLYYVTGRALLPPSTDKDYYLTHLEQSITGGVTVVQIREKDVDGGEFYEVARRSKEVCDKVSRVMFLGRTVLSSSRVRRL